MRLFVDVEDGFAEEIEEARQKRQAALSAAGFKETEITKAQWLRALLTDGLLKAQEVKKTDA
jgi:hypothetical protein